MKTRLLLPFLLPLILHCQQWVQVNNFPEPPRDDATCFTINDTVYCGSGLSPWFSPLGDFYKFSPTTTLWTPATDLPTSKERQYAASASVNNLGFLFGGHDGTTFLSDLWQFDPSQNAWSALPSLPADGRGGSCLIALEDSLILVGGRTSSSSATNEVWCYSLLNNTWSQLNNFPTTCFKGNGFAQNGSAYVIFGSNNSDTPSNALYNYDAQADQWTLTSTLPSDLRNYAIAAVINNKLYTGLGVNNSGLYLNDFWEYSFETNSWLSLPNLPTDKLKGGSCFISNNHLYYCTGINQLGERSNEVWKYTAFLATPEITEPTLTLFPNPATHTFQIINKPINSHVSGFSLHGAPIPLEQIDTNTFDMSHLPPGQYIIQVFSEDQFNYFKLTKQ